MQKKKTSDGCSPTAGNGGCAPGCKVEAVLSVDERGQMVLPKDVRQKAGIKTGDKLALIRLGDEWQYLLSRADESREPERNGKRYSRAADAAAREKMRLCRNG